MINMGYYSDISDFFLIQDLCSSCSPQPRQAPGFCFLQRSHAGATRRLPWQRQLPNRNDQRGCCRCFTGRKGRGTGKGNLIISWLSKGGFRCAAAGTLACSRVMQGSCLPTNPNAYLGCRWEGPADTVTGAGLRYHAPEAHCHTACARPGPCPVKTFFKGISTPWGSG